VPARRRKLVLAIETSNPGAHAAEDGVGTRAKAAVNPKLGQETEAARPTPEVALGEIVDGGSSRLLGAEPLRKVHRHDDDLAPAIDRLLRACDASPSDLARVAVSIGPGGYTAVRIALATAKMIALATGARLVGVPTALASAWAETALPVIICLASKNQTAHASALLDDGAVSQTLRSLDPEPKGVIRLEISGGLRELRPLGLVDAKSPVLRAALPHAARLIADHHLPDTLRQLARSCGTPVHPPSFAAASVLALSDLLPELQGSDIATLAPIYPREPDAVTQWRKRAGG
jgi:tRNA threonylcarbamoyl adenosine modification protein YeaZ